MLTEIAYVEIWKSGCAQDPTMHGATPSYLMAADYGTATDSWRTAACRGHVTIAWAVICTREGATGFYSFQCLGTPANEEAFTSDQPTWLTRYARLSKGHLRIIVMVPSCTSANFLRCDIPVMHLSITVRPRHRLLVQLPQPPNVEHLNSGRHNTRRASNESYMKVTSFTGKKTSGSSPSSILSLFCFLARTRWQAVSALMIHDLEILASALDEELRYDTDP